MHVEILGRELVARCQLALLVLSPMLVGCHGGGFTFGGTSSSWSVGPISAGSGSQKKCDEWRGRARAALAGYDASELAERTLRLEDGQPR